MCYSPETHKLERTCVPYAQWSGSPSIMHDRAVVICSVQVVRCLFLEVMNAVCEDRHTNRHTHAGTHTHTHTHTGTHIHTDTHTHTHTHSHVGAHTHTHTDIRTGTQTGRHTKTYSHLPINQRSEFDCLATCGRYDEARAERGPGRMFFHMMVT